MELFEKSQTIDPEVRAYVYSLVSAIGGSSAADDGRYVLGDDALACLKDLKRWLKLYDAELDRFDVKRCLSEANLVRGDLLEILGQWKDDDQKNALRRKLAIGSLELLTDLTWPLVIDPERATTNKVRHLPVLQLAQVDYKRAILHHDSGSILRKAIAAAVPALTSPRKERTPRDEGTINLVLYLFRNVVAIAHPSGLPTNGEEEDISRSETIRALHEQDVLQLVLTICSGMGEDFDIQDVVVLELLYHLVKGIDPKTLFRTEQQLQNDNTKTMVKLLQAERAMRASHATSAPTRHNRFGTMIWVKQADEKVSTMRGQDTITSEQKALQKMDSSKQWNKPRSAKKNVSPGDPVDFLPVHIGRSARRQLEEFVSEFLDSSFNPLFIHLRKAIDRESERIKEDHPRQFFYLMSWFLKAEEARREAVDPCALDPTTAETSFAYIGGAFTHEVFVMLNRTLQRNLDDKSWNDVHTCMLAFTQIIQSVSAMSESPSEEDQEIAENIQSRIFYEEGTHDRVLQALRAYQDGRQGLAYLDACTELAHVFIRLLERYSKVNVDMFVKSKRRARRKAAARPTGNATIEGLEDDRTPVQDDAANDEIEAHRQVQERKFDFVKFAARFINETSINTYVAFLRRYRDLNEEQLKRCHRFFYRVAFKLERPILLYRVDILNLLFKIVKGPDGLDSRLERKHAHYTEWEELIRQIFRRCVKKIEERPEMIVEMLFTKISNTLFFLEHGYDKEIVKAAPRPPAELVVKPGMDHVQEIGVAVGILVDQGKLDALVWIKNVMMSAIDERRSWEDMNQAMDSEAPQEPPSLFGSTGNTGPDQESTSADDQVPDAVGVATPKERPSPPVIVLQPDTEERRTATFKDKHLRLLLKTLRFVREGAKDEPKADWIVPSELSADSIEADLDVIRKAEFEPPTYEDGKSAESFIRSEATIKRNAYEKEASDDDGDSDLDESLFVPGGPTRRPDDPRDQAPKRKRLRRKGDGITDEQQAERAEARRQREREKDAKIKSTLFVTESDDEDNEERDAEFFRLEAARRGMAASSTKELLMDGRTGHGEERASTKAAKRKTKEVTAAASKKRKTRKAVIDVDSDAEGKDDDAGDAMIISSRESSVATEDSLSEEEPEAVMSEDETPLSSHHDGQTDATGKVRHEGTLREMSGNEQRPVDTTADIDGDEEEDAAMPVKISRRPRRSLFVVDEDDDD